MDYIVDRLEEWAGIWAKVFAFDLGRYAIAATAMAALVLLLLAVAARQGRIQTRRATRADIRREIFTSVRTAFVFSLTGVGVIVGVRYGVFTVYGTMAEAGWIYLVVSVAAMLVAHDTYFYWTHRAMHQRRLYRLFHRTHHKSVAPTAFAAYAFDVPEAIVQSAFMPLWLLFAPMHTVGLFAFMAVMIVRNVMGHSGYEVHPRGMASSPWLGWMTTTTHHDLHHSTMNHNFGLYFTWWDRWMKTEHPKYVETFDRATISLCPIPSAKVIETQKG